MNPRLHSPHKNGSSTCSISGAFVGSFELHCRTSCETTTPSQKLESHPRLHSYVTAVYASWAMFTKWMMGAYSMIYSTASSPLGQGVEAAPCYASRTYTSVTWRHATLTPSHGKSLQTTELCGSRKYHIDWKEGSYHPRQLWKKGQKNSQATAGPSRPTTDVCLHVLGLQQRLQIQIGRYSNTRRCSSRTSHSATP